MNGARSAHLVGYAGGLGIALAIEPAGGVSPLRGGAGMGARLLSTVSYPPFWRC